MSDPNGYCQKTAEIAKLEEQVKTLNGIVMGNEGLAQTVPVLNRNVSELSKTIGVLTTGVSGLLKFQETETGRRQGRFEMKQRNRWIVGIMVTLAVAIISGLIYLVVTVMQHVDAL